MGRNEKGGITGGISGAIGGGLGAWIGNAMGFELGKEDKMKMKPGTNNEHSRNSDLAVHSSNLSIGGN